MSSSASRIRTVDLLIAMFLLLIGTAPGAAAEPNVFIEITKEEGRRITVAVTPFAVLEDAGETDLRSVLETDLRIAGFFRLLPMGPLQREIFQIETTTGKVQYASWTDWGAELLLRASFRSEGRSVVLEGRLIDVSRGKLLLGREYRGKRGQEVKAIHSLADDVVKTLTGDGGVSLTRMVYAGADKGPKRIFIADYVGNDVRPVSTEGVLSLYPAWFPDGRRIAYVSYRRGRTEIVIHDLRTGRIKSFAFFPGMNAFPAISPDGRSMLLTLSRDGNPEIYRIETDGSSLRRLTFTKAVEASPVWSPDGGQVAFVSDRSGSPQIYVSSSRGGRARRISFTGYYSSSPDWSPKGGEVVFTSMVGKTFQLFLVDLGTGETKQLTTGGRNREDPSWAPNGRHVVYSEGRGATYRLAILDTVTGESFPVPCQSGSCSSPSWSR